MTLERRLQHAARELREVRVDVPPLGSSSGAAPRSRVSMPVAPLLAPLLFVIGALFAIGATRGTESSPMPADDPTVQTTASPSPVVDEASAEASVPAPPIPVDPDVISERVIRQRTSGESDTQLDISWRTTTTPGILGPI